MKRKKKKDPDKKWMLNIVALYPKSHCSRCTPRECDECGRVGFFCKTGEDGALRVAMREGMTTMLQYFTCRSCRSLGRLDKFHEWTEWLRRDGIEPRVLDET